MGVITAEPPYHAQVWEYPPLIPLKMIQWLQILGDNIFLTLEWQLLVAFYIGFNVGLTPYN